MLLSNFQKRNTEPPFHWTCLSRSHSYRPSSMSAAACSLTSLCCNITHSMLPIPTQLHPNTSDQYFLSLVCSSCMKTWIFLLQKNLLLSPSNTKNSTSLSRSGCCEHSPTPNDQVRSSADSYMLISTTFPVTMWRYLIAGPTRRCLRLCGSGVIDTSLSHGQQCQFSAQSSPKIQ